MATVNENRGRSLFKTKLLNQDVSKEIQSKLDLLYETFKEQVGVMPVDNLYGASVLAQACIEVAQDKKYTSENLTAQIVHDKYFEIQNTKSQEADKLKAEIQSQQRRFESGGIELVEISGSREAATLSSTSKNFNSEIDEYYKQALIDDNINMENGSETIDMIHDWGIKRGATTEGKRALGLIPANFDANNEDEPEVEMEQPKMAEITEDEDGFPLILCPDCHGVEIYPTGSTDTFSCFNCNNQFYTDLNLNDLTDEDSLQELTGSIQQDENDSKIIRIDGDIRSRGRKFSE